jgi:hypothetical protein
MLSSRVAHLVTCHLHVSCSIYEFESRVRAPDINQYSPLFSFLDPCLDKNFQTKQRTRPLNTHSWCHSSYVFTSDDLLLMIIVFNRNLLFAVSNRRERARIRLLQREISQASVRFRAKFAPSTPQTPASVLTTVCSLSTTLG